MRTMLRQVALGLSVAALSGCLQFEEQTMTYHVDRGADCLRIFQDYRGIYGADADGDEKQPLSAQEQGQLESLLEGQHTFFFNNWIFEYKRAAVEEALANLKDPEWRKENEIDPADLPALQKLAGLALADIRVENGAFYLGAGKKLCGVQLVTVGNLSKLVAALNECGAFFMRDSLQEDTTPADRAAVAKFVAGARPFIEIDGNQLIAHWPLSRGTYEETYGAKMEDPARVNEMRRAGFDIAWAEDVVTFKLGAADEALTKVTMSGNGGKYVPNAIAPAKKLHCVEESFDAERDAERFLLR